MGKKLIFSDVHIYNYSNYNLSNKFRLYQNRKVAELLARSGVENGCDGFIIAGDLIEKPTLVSRILSETKKFMEYLCKVFPGNNYFIVGQHDLDTKDNNQSEEDSVLPLISPSNLIYSDKKIFNIDGRSVAFMNWRPDQDLSWIEGQVDLFIGHATIALPNSLYKGQSIDTSKFKLGIFGDIHRHFSFGNIVMCGTPVQNKMGDQLESTAIVWDPSDNSWEVINIDPEDELFKMKYTSDKSMEGFIDNYYYIYKPSSKVTDSGEVISIPQWEEVNDLVENIISSNNLSDIHNKVLSECKYTEDVDFNFQITKLRLKDFRSIDSMELDFTKGDKIRISGGNGNGKSSLILGLKYALIENRSLKDYVRFDQPSCECEVEFIYQGIKFKLLRGTKVWGLWINGDKQPYNNKREFEDDCHKRFPFIDYMDIYFFTSGQSSILGSMAPERKSEVISKLFKLDKIDSYNYTATLMYDRIKSLINSTSDRISKVKEVVNYIHSKVDNIELPNLSKPELISKRKDLYDIRDSYNRYLINKNEISKLEGVIQSNESLISKLSEDIISLERHQELEDELIALDHDISMYESDLNNNRVNIHRRNQLNDKLKQINEDGTQLYNKIHLLVNSEKKICPTCGSEIDDMNAEKLVSDLTSNMNNLVNIRDSLIKEINEIPNINEESILIELNKMRNDRIRINEILSNSLNSSKRISDLSRSTESYKSQLSILLNSCNSEVTELPNNINENIDSLSLGISVWDNYEKNIMELKEKESILNSYIDELNDISKSNSDFEKYIKLTGSTGDIYKEIMTQLSREFSDDVIRYEVNQYKYRNRDHLDLDIQYKVKGRWVGYSSLSSGQQTMADFNFLSRICTGLGLLVCDETLKHLSEESTEYVLELIGGMNVNNVLLSSHMINVNFHNREIELELDENGITKIM
jgi:ABC-type lipoprotein export system ATPase subunit